MHTLRSGVLRRTAVIPGAAANVRELIVNPRRRAEWLPELDITGAPDRPLVAGDAFEGYASLLGHRFAGRSDVIAADDRSIEERVVIGARITTRWDLIAAGDGSTEVTHTLDVEFPRGPFGWLERWVLTRRLATMQRDEMRRLAGAVEVRSE